MPELAKSDRHEAPAISTCPVVITMAALFGLVALSLIAAAMLLRAYLGHIAPSPLPAPDFAEPRLQISKTADLVQLKQREQIRLHEGAAMPIERAMDAIAQRGPDAFSPLVPSDKPIGGGP